MSAAAAGKLAADNPQATVVAVVAAGAVIYLIASKMIGEGTDLIRDAGKEVKKGAKFVAREAGEFADFAEDKAEDAVRGAKKSGAYVSRTARRASKEAIKDTKSALRGAKRAVTKNRVTRGAKKAGGKAKKASKKAKRAFGRIFG